MLALSVNQAFAIDLDKLAGAVQSATAGNNNQKNSGLPLGNIQDQLLGKVEEKINKVTDRIEGRIEKYEKKFDAYEKKIDKAEKATDQVIKTMEKFNQSEIANYIVMAKYAAIAFAIIFISSFVMLIVIFMNSIKTKRLLRK